MPKVSIAQNESVAERAAMSVHLAVADFMVAILEAPTTDAALDIHHLVSDATRALQAIEGSALNRADALNGRN